ncbi:helix-turn-helix transcriptional regulator [Streptococcus sp. 20-1249]|uniref:helix-turn-helix transcriptional regulator n=1 Tax=Streptococcus hepaticus TaxID=3349163 RepID=UPI003747C335
MDARLNPYPPLIDFLAQVMGRETEIVLQDFTDGLDHSLVYIKNNLSGRKVGAPATDLILEILQSKVYLEEDYVVNYRTRSIAGKEMYSSSYFIKDQGQLIGAICINVDKTRLLALKNLFESTLVSLKESLQITDEPHQQGGFSAIENFYETADQLIEDIIIRETQGKDLTKHRMTRTEKIAIVRSLYQKGFFDFKDAVSKTAEAFRMSEVSIYKYIQQVKQEENAD